MEGIDRDVAAEATSRRWPRLALRTLVGIVAFLVLGNGLILGSTLWFRWSSPAAAADASGIDNLHVVDGRLLRGAAPSAEGLRDLAALGVTTVVDLRAEADLVRRDDLLAELGMERFHLPIRDGQLPSAAQARELLRIVEDADGTVFLHCGAGVGRTGALTAFYLNATGQTDGTGALRHNLSVGPPSLEQIAFSVKTASGSYDRPGVGVTALSRVLDAPRRIWHNLT
jgi:protein-tyrosine phosphatase